MLCVLIVEGMSVVVNVMLSLMSVMSTPPALCNLSVRTDVKMSACFFVFFWRGRFIEISKLLYKIIEIKT